MKFIDNNGKIFKKINILDFLFIIFVVFLVFLSVIRVLGKDLDDISIAPTERVKVEVSATILLDKGYINAIKEGDQLGETKEYLDAYVDKVEILPVYSTNLDINGNPVVSIDPTMDRAELVFTADVPYENMSYKLGNQELRQGKMIFIESDLYRYRAQIESLKVVN